MSKKWMCIALLVFAVPTCFAAGATTAKVDGKEEPKLSLEDVNVDKISETLGHLIVRHLENPGFKFNVAKIMEGMKNEAAGKPSPMSEEEYEQTVSMIQENLFVQLAEKNLGAAVAFLEKNAKEEGVISLNPKLQYKVVAAGDGEVVNAESIPLVHYTGKLMDGTAFSSSKESNRPISLPIKQTIPGFTEGLVGMKKGEKRVLYIHPELAYGVSGHLPPNSLLIFEVEIVEADTKAALSQTAEGLQAGEETIVSSESEEISPK